MPPLTVWNFSFCQDFPLFTFPIPTHSNSAHSPTFVVFFFPPSSVCSVFLLTLFESLFCSLPPFLPGHVLIGLPSFSATIVLIKAPPPTPGAQSFFSYPTSHLVRQSLSNESKHPFLLPLFEAGLFTLPSLFPDVFASVPGLHSFPLSAIVSPHVLITRLRLPFAY